MAEKDYPKGSVWNCPGCGKQLVEKSVKDYVDKAIDRMHRFKLKQVRDLKQKIQEADEDGVLTRMIDDVFKR